jgi:hypothetical protein
MRAFHDLSPMPWLMLTAAAVVVALATGGFFAVIWLLAHSD